MSKLTKYDIPSIEELPEIDKPLFHRVAVVPLDPITKTAGGIIMPDSAKDAAAWVQHLGVLVALGDGAFRTQDGEEVCRTAPKLGDVVMYGKFAGLKYEREIESEPDVHGITEKKKPIKVIIIQDTDIISVIKDPTGIRTDK